MAETVPVTLPAETLRALRERTDHGERIAAIMARIRRSLDDPRPDLTGEEVSANPEERVAQAERDGRRRA